jgi:hypothetical protein
MRAVNSQNSQQAIRATVKLFNDFKELGHAIFAFFRPVKVKSSVVIADDQMVNPPDGGKPVQDNHSTGSIPGVLEAWHEFESWDLTADAQKRPAKGKLQKSIECRSMVSIAVGHPSL